MPLFSTKVLSTVVTNTQFLRLIDSVAVAGFRFWAFRGEVRSAMEDQKTGKTDRNL
jgi:hypothetical protein